jgi:hypothetical protein
LWRRSEGVNKAPDFVLPDVVELLDAVGAAAEKVEYKDPVETLPQSVGGLELEFTSIDVDDPDGMAPWPRRKESVLAPRDLPGGLRGHCHHEGDLAELEVQEWCVQLGRKAGKHTVHERAAGEMVQAANDR